MKRTLCWERVVALSMLALIALASAGCHSPTVRLHPVSAPIKSARTRAQPSGSPVAPFVAMISKIQTRPEYREAQAKCRKKQYKQAAESLQRLASARNLSAEERAYVQDQRALCLKDAGLPVPHRHPAQVRAAQTRPLLKPLTAAEADCGPRALLLLCKQLGKKTTLAALRQATGCSGEGTTFAGMTEGIHAATGLKAEGVQVSREALPSVATPCIAWVNSRHYIEVVRLSGSGEDGKAILHDPNSANEQEVSQEQLLRMSAGYLLLIHE